MFAGYPRELEGHDYISRFNIKYSSLNLSKCFRMLALSALFLMKMFQFDTCTISYAASILLRLPRLCVCVCVQNVTNFCPYALISTSNVPSIFFTQQISNLLPLGDRFLRLSFVFYDKKSLKNRKCSESVSIGVIDEVRRDERNAILQINRVSKTLT